MRDMLYFEEAEGTESTESTEGTEGQGTEEQGKGTEEQQFTPEQQAKIDKIIQARVAREKSQKQELLTQLEQFKKNRALSEEDKSRLQGQIDKLNASLMTKEELAAREKKELEVKLTEKITELETQAKFWQEQHLTSTKRRALTDAAVSEEAFSPKQIVSLLEPMTRLDEVLDENNSPTGEFIAMITLDSKDEAGKPTKLDLPVQDALKEMKKMTGDYGNLFKSGVTAGVGGNTFSGNAGGEVDVSNTDAYIKARRSGKLSLDQLSSRLLKR